MPKARAGRGAACCALFPCFLPYNCEDVDTLLRLGEDYDGPPRLTSGLVEMQRLFMIAAKNAGLK